MYKKVVLGLIVFFEFFLGILLVFNYFQSVFSMWNNSGVNKIAVINKERVELVNNNGFKYYWKYLPNEEIEDQPNWLPYKATYLINNDSLNDLNNYPTTKGENTYRIITLGDSYTFGQYVNTQDNWTEQLEILLNDSLFNCKYDHFEVINLGMPGWDIPYIVQRYKEIGQKYNPDLILWLESDSGFFRLNEFMRPIIEKCIDSGINLPKDDYSLCWNKANKEIKEKYSLKEVSRIVQKDFNVFFDLIQEKKVVIAYYYRLFGEKKNIATDLNNKYPNVDFLYFSIEPTKDEQLPDSHPSVKGHSNIADHFFNYLKTDRNICEYNTTF